jgi:outer membrane protein assembly factor BamB
MHHRIRSRTSQVALALCLLLALSIGAAQGGEWNQWRGPNRDGVAPSSPALIRSLPPSGLQPIWTSEPIPSGFDAGWGSPVVAEGRVYLFLHRKALRPGVTLGPMRYPWLAEDKRGHLTAAEYEEYEQKRRDEDQERAAAYIFEEAVFCLDATTGKTLWVNRRESRYTRFVQSGTLAVHEGLAYFLGAARTARCIDARTGKDVWDTALPGDFRDEYYMSSFAVADGVAAVFAGHLFALDAKTGRLLWQGDPRRTSGVHTSPAVWTHAGQAHFIANVAGTDTICVEPRTGRELWRVDTGANHSTPVISPGDRLITFGSSRKRGLRCFALSPGGATAVWEYQGCADPGASPVVVGDYVYAQGERTLACVRLADGQEMWQTRLTKLDPRYTSLLAADAKVFYACEGLLCLPADPAAYQTLFDGKFNAAGLLADEATHRALLDLDKIAAGEGGLERAEKLYHRNVEAQGPAKCTTPAFADGFLFIRSTSAVHCYDLRR